MLFGYFILLYIKYISEHETDITIFTQPLTHSQNFNTKIDKILWNIHFLFIFFIIEMQDRLKELD